jgi:tetratricopeptide (TPR) repeat protein
VPGVDNFYIGLPERDNLLYACEWARGEKQADILASLTTKSRNWFMVNFSDAWIYWFAWLEACLQLGLSDDGLKANVLKAIGDVQQFRDDRDAALESYEEALKLFRQVGAKLGEANVLATLSRMAVRAGNIEEAEEQFRKNIESRRAIHDLYSEGADIGNFAIVLLESGYKDKAKEYAIRAKEIFKKIDLPAIVEMMDKIIVASEEGDE